MKLKPITLNKLKMSYLKKLTKRGGKNVETCCKIPVVMILQ